jgi:hypothetical protein
LATKLLLNTSRKTTQERISWFFDEQKENFLNRSMLQAEDKLRVRVATSTNSRKKFIQSRVFSDNKNFSKFFSLQPLGCGGKKALVMEIPPGGSKLHLKPEEVKNATALKHISAEL